MFALYNILILANTIANILFFFFLGRIIYLYFTGQYSTDKVLYTIMIISALIMIFTPEHCHLQEIMKLEYNSCTNK